MARRGPRQPKGPPKANKPKASKAPVAPGHDDLIAKLRRRLKECRDTYEHHARRETTRLEFVRAWNKYEQEIEESCVALERARDEFLRERAPRLRANWAMAKRLLGVHKITYRHPIPYDHDFVRLAIALDRAPYSAIAQVLYGRVNDKTLARVRERAKRLRATGSLADADRYAAARGARKEPSRPPSEFSQSIDRFLDDAERAKE
jgi:hypothetical protein